jgi:hypothetical protein
MFDYSPAGIEAFNDEVGAIGDARCCPRHPGVKTSSDDGLFDGVCGLCEADMADDVDRWGVDPENPHRSQCGYGVGWFPPGPRLGIACVPSEDDGIPF